MPSSPLKPDRQKRLERLIARPFAHRGLHGQGRIENSRAAFHAAVLAGHGIELDVQLSADGEAVVFHDDRLDRLAEAQGPVAGRSAQDLASIRLRGSSETIPPLAEILELIAGRTPLLIELKASGRRVGALSGAVDRALGDYVGEVAVMSFNPAVGHWFAKRAPHQLRGLVVTEAGKPSRGRLRRALSTIWSSPDFLAYDIRDLPSRFADRHRRRGLKLLTWTCRNADHRAIAAAHTDQIIFEEPA
jgi:glycerophosphoryl diester phosphodiesterase